MYRWLPLVSLLFYHYDPMISAQKYEIGKGLQKQGRQLQFVTSVCIIRVKLNKTSVRKFKSKYFADLKKRVKKPGRYYRQHSSRIGFKNKRTSLACWWRFRCTSEKVHKGVAEVWSSDKYSHRDSSWNGNKDLICWGKMVGTLALRSIALGKIPSFKNGVC